jgi:uncharacterized protein YhhL (DUF1145 family)
VTGVLTVVLFALGGVLIGGAWSMRQQGASKYAVMLFGVMAVMSVTAGALRLVYG